MPGPVAPLSVRTFRPIILICVIFHFRSLCQIKSMVSLNLIFVPLGLEYFSAWAKRNTVQWAITIDSSKGMVG